MASSASRWRNPLRRALLRSPQTDCESSAVCDASVCNAHAITRVLVRSPAVKSHAASVGCGGAGSGSDLAWRPVGHLFGPNVSRVAFKRGAYLRHFVFAFAELLGERLTRAVIERAMAERDGGPAATYEL